MDSNDTTTIHQDQEEISMAISEEKLKGSIRDIKRGKKNIRASIDLPRGEDGERNRLTKTFKSREQALDWLVKKNYQLTEGIAEKESDMNLHRYLEMWLHNKWRTLKETTYHKYKYVIEKHINPAMGNYSLKRLNPVLIRSWINDKLEDGLSNSSVRTYYRTLNTAINDAVKDGMIDDNPMETVDMPSPSDTEIEYWTEDEVDEFLESIKDVEPYHTLFQLTLTTGLRRSEVLGLKWEAVDLEEQLLEVKRAITFPDSGPKVGPPKSKSSKRTIRLKKSTVKNIKSLKKNTRHDNPDDWVFHTEEGHFLKEWPVRKHLEKHIEETDVSEISFHGLRHTHATLALQSEMNFKTLSERLGHSSIKITLDRYSHVTSKMQKQELDKFPDI